MGLLFDLEVFFYNPSNFYVTLASVMASLLFFLIMKFNKKASNSHKLMLAYMHVFALVFPVLYFVYSTGCRMLFSSCHRFQAIMYITALALLSALIAAMLVSPLVIYQSFKKKSKQLQGSYLSDFVEQNAVSYGLKEVKLYLLKTAKPLAMSFSHFRKSIFISVGMIDLLGRKEIEAVLLHELSHLKDNTPSLKISSFFLRILSPLSKFASFGREIDEEERNADKFAVGVQGTRRHIFSARKKTDEFFRNYNDLK